MNGNGAAAQADEIRILASDAVSALVFLVTEDDRP
jgi:hypothetical protein